MKLSSPFNLHDLVYHTNCHELVCKEDYKIVSKIASHI